jgi:RHS repeat-associated protein
VVQSEYEYDPFGRPSKIAGSGSAPDFQYAGYYVHGRSGLNMSRTRAYRADVGRFISRDIIGEDGGVNLYAYVKNMPTGMTDPSGMFLAPAIPAAAVVVGGVVFYAGLGWFSYEAGRASYRAWHPRPEIRFPPVEPADSDNFDDCVKACEAAVLEQAKQWEDEWERKNKRKCPEEVKERRDEAARKAMKECVRNHCRWKTGAPKRFD